MRVSSSLIKSLQSLLNGENIAASRLRLDIQQTLLEEGLVSVQSHGTRRGLRAVNISALHEFLQKNYEEFRCLDSESEFMLASDRAGQAAVSGNSKLREERSCPGFMVNSYEPVSTTLNGKSFTVAPIEGMMLYIADWEHFIVSEEVLIVGVENMENFRQIRRQRCLFPMDVPILFVSRYPQSTDLRQWLMKIPNHYLHFGDFDLAGMQIYENEFYKYLPDRASFMIPNDIVERIKNGSSIRFNNQYKKFKDYTPSDSRLFDLFHLIHHYHRCYDQEGYILSE